jgi:sugar/nucleoside kinase (ribokinase family)
MDVVVIGNAGVDTNIYLPGADIDFGVEANFTENLDYVGQAGGYASRGYAQMGYKTAFIGALGDDFSGDLVRLELARDGVDTSAVFPDPRGTARSVNFMYRDGRRKNFYDGKSHMTLLPDLPQCQRILSGARLAHFNIPNWARRLLPLARQNGVTIACDIQDVVDPHDPYRLDFIAYADILFFSAANQLDPSTWMRTFLERNPRLLVVTGMGAQGAGLGRRLPDGQVDIRFYPPPSLDLPVLDTNGAGDALAVGFLCSYVLDSRSPEDALLRGQVAARHTCSLRASSTGLITPALMESYLRQLNQ